MKMMFLLLITLITFTNVSYASFPITSSNTSEASTTISFQDPDDEEEDPSWWIVIYILNFIIVVGGFLLLLRTWWRAWKKRKRWARLLPWLILITIPILGLIGLLFQGSGMGG